MSREIGAYLVSIVASVMLLSLVQSILPPGAVKKVVGFMGGLIVVLTVLSPFVEIDPEQLLRAESRFRREARSISVEESRELMARIIMERCRTYILDKAGMRDMDIAVEVILGKEGEYPCPEAVILTGAVTPAQQSWLTQEITRDLGIPAERQEWRSR